MSGLIRGARLALGWRRAGSIGLPPTPSPPPVTGASAPALIFSITSNSQYVPVISF